MINQLEIENFQAHRHSLIEFNKGVNVITGTSDAGKSAILRALRWVIYNRPNGDSFKNWNAKKGDSVAVTVEFSDGQVVTKERSKTNVYHLVNQNKTLEAVKSDIPDELQAITKMVDYNFQTQHQPYFLLQETPGEIAKHFNRLIGLDVIDRVFKNINSSIADSSKEVARLVNENKEINRELSNLEYLDDYERQINKIEAEVESYEKNRHRAEQTGIIIDQIDSIDDKIKSAKEILKAEKDLEEIQALLQEYEATKKKANLLDKLIYDLEAIEEEIESSKEILIMSKPVAELQDLLKSFRENDNKAESLDELITSIVAVENSITSNKVDFDEALGEYIALLEKNKECPTCHQSISSSTVKKIKEKLLK